MFEVQIKRIALAFALLSLAFVSASAQTSTYFTPGNLVVLVEGCGVHAGTCTNVPNGNGTGSGNSSVGGYGDNQGAPLTLFQYAPTGTSSVAFVNSLVLPQTGSGANLPLAGEYGSSSEGTLNLSVAGQYLTLMEYGINAATFDAAPATYGAAPSLALAQSGSLTGQSYTPIARVVTLIDANANVNSSTPVFNIFNTNNPRSVATVNGTTAYVSGQGSGSDATGGVFFVPLGTTTTSPTAITGLDTTGKTLSQDTRDVQIFNNTLYVSVDTKGGSNSARDFIGTLGTPPATTLFNSSSGPTQLTGFATKASGTLTITSGANSNGNAFNSGLQINLSPVNYFFASPSVLYVADSGTPKNNSANSLVGDGGLQKWLNTKSDGSGTWNLEYTLYQGLNLVQNTAGTGTSGLYGLTGVVSGNTVQLYATNYTLTDLDFTYLYGITDNLTFTTATQAAGETFTLLDTAPADSNFKGISFAPTIPAGDVEVTSLPSGLAFTSAGTGCAPGTSTTPITLAWTPASNCTLSVTTPQSGGTGTQYTFQHWEDGTTNTTHSVTAPTTTAAYTATFATQYQLTLAAGPGGSIAGPANPFITAGTTVVIQATPATNFCFVNFTGTTTSTSNPLSLVLNSPQSITANFASGSGLYSPAPNSTLAGASATFNWCSFMNATAYWLDIGAEQGGHEYYSSGSLPNSATSQAVTSLPTDGSTVWARFYAQINGTWGFTDYSYTASGSSAKGVITSPTPGSQLTGTGATFNWSAASGASGYWLDAGSTAGGHDYSSSGNLGNVLTTTVNGLPANGSTVYVTLYTLQSGTWISNPYTYTAYNLAAADGVMTSPTPASTLTGSTVTFNWSAGTGASGYWVDAGSTAGAHDYYSSGNLGNVLSTTVSGLPTDGSTVYVTLYTLIGGTWSANAYTYTALNATSGLAVMQTPTPNSTLSGGTATFTWSADANATSYWMDIGATAGGNTIYSSGNLGNVQTTTVNSLPADGSTIYVTLYSFVGGQWLHNSYTYISGQ